MKIQVRPGGWFIIAMALPILASSFWEATPKWLQYCEIGAIDLGGLAALLYLIFEVRRD